jgi:hypothetical protein
VAAVVASVLPAARAARVDVMHASTSCRRCGRSDGGWQRFTPPSVLSRHPGASELQSKDGDAQPPGVDTG